MKKKRIPPSAPAPQQGGPRGPNRPPVPGGSSRKTGPSGPQGKPRHTAARTGQRGR